MADICADCGWAKVLGRTLWCGYHDKAIKDNFIACDHYVSAAAQRAVSADIDKIILDMGKEVEKERSATKRNKIINAMSSGDIDIDNEIDKIINAVCVAEKARITEQYKSERKENNSDELELPPGKYFSTFLKDCLAWALALVFIGGGICVFLFC